MYKNIKWVTKACDWSDNACCNLVRNNITSKIFNVIGAQKMTWHF